MELILHVTLFLVHPTLGESVFARCLSSLKDERVNASKQLRGPASTKYGGNKGEFVEHIRKVRITYIL